MSITWGYFYGVGVGPGDPRLLTLWAVEVLQSVDFVAVPKSKLEGQSIAWEIAKVHCPAGTRLLELETPMTAERQVLNRAWRENAQIILKELKRGKAVAFLTLGDPSLYSTYSYLLAALQAELPAERIVTVPGITAMSAGAAKLNLPLALGDEPLLVLPSAEDWEKFLCFPNLVLLKVSRRLPEILRRLETGRRKGVLLTRLGQKGEKIFWAPKAGDFPAGKIDYFSMMLVKEDLAGRTKSEGNSSMTFGAAERDDNNCEGNETCSSEEVCSDE